MSQILDMYQMQGGRAVRVPGPQHESRITALEGSMTSVVSIPAVSITTAPIGYASTFSVSAVSLLNPAQAISKFILNVPELGITEREFTADNEGAASVTIHVPSATEEGLELTVYVQAVDALGNRSRKQAHKVTTIVGRIGAPTLTAPTANAEEIYNGTDGVTLRTSAFTVSGMTDTHASTDWRVTSDAAGQNAVATLTESADLLSHTFFNLGLTDGQTYYASARHRGDILGAGNWSEPVPFVAKSAYVETPSITAPAAQAEVVFNAGGVTLSAGPFSVYGGTDTHISSDWRIARDASATEIMGEANGSNDLREHTFTGLGLVDGNTYYAFVRFTGQRYGASQWSAPVAFRAKAGYVKQPTLSTPTANADVVYNDVGLTITGSAFETVGTTDTQVSADYRITSDISGNAVVAEAMNSNDLTAHTFTAAQLATLTDGMTYYAWTRQKGTSLGDSQWSAPVAFRTKRAYIAAPSITAPSGEVVFSLGVTVQTSAFAAMNATDGHHSTDWRITSDAAGQQVVAEAVGSSDLLSHTFTGLNLTDAASYYAWARHRGNKFGYSDWSLGGTFTAKAGYVKTPSISAPTANANVVFNDTGVTISTSAFDYVGDTETHASTDYKICADSAGADVVYSANASSDLTSHTFAAAGLELVSGQTYYAFARHRGSNFGASEWSAGRAFTALKGVIAQPSVTSPTSGAEVVVSGGLVVNSSAFSAQNGTDTHASTDWRVTTASSGGTTVAEALNSSDLTSHTFTGLSVTAGQVYYVSCRHKGTKFGASEWSASVPFTAKLGIERRGCTLYRSANNVATTIEATDADGSALKFEVIDAAYRSASKQFGTYGTDNPNLTNYSDYTGTNGGSRINDTSSNLDHTADVPSEVTMSFLVSHFGAKLASDTSSKTNCDSWMTYNSATDTQGIVGVPAVAHCRGITQDGGGWDLPREWLLMILYMLAEEIDALDPTAAANPTLALGHNVNTSGRFYFAGAGFAWSSAEYGNYYCRVVYYNGDVTSNYEYNYGAAVPVREL